eukprot:m.73237 g.73237  ORF g.73237 m.73237 type:complete len:305 (-) comp8413_c0_seq8:519-1433(-)
MTSSTSTLLRHLPSCRFAFAYGSAAFKQHGHTYNKNTMLDLILAVEDSQAFHSANIAQNPTHYSMFAKCGANAVAELQRSAGAKVYYNPFVSLDGQLVKYGVVDEKDMLDDLLNWNTLYVSGRLHKPVNILQLPDSDSTIQDALAFNLRAASTVALLTLPKQFTEFDLFVAISSLSYTGDFRMAGAEKKGKVESIVRGNFSAFHTLYAPVFQSLVDIKLSGTQDTLIHNPMHGISVVELEDNVNIPSGIKSRLSPEKNAQDNIHDALKDIVGESSILQALVGIISAGPVKSTKYAAEKLRKAWL